MERNEIEALIKNEVVTQVRAELKENSIDKLNNAFTRWKIIAGVFASFIAVVVTTQLIGVGFAGKIFYQIFPLPDDQISVSYADVFVLSSGTSNDDKLSKAVRYYANKTQFVRFYVKVDGYPNIDKPNIIVQNGVTGKPTTLILNGAFSKPTLVKNESDLFSDESNVHSLVFRIEQKISNVTHVVKPSKVIVTVIILVMGNSKYG